MNERIKELSNQAYDELVNETGNIVVFDEDFQQRFAQLIVRECMRMCDCADSSYLEHGCDLEASGAAGAKELIKEWFEVEE